MADDLMHCLVCDGLGYLSCDDSSEIQCEHCDGTGKVPASSRISLPTATVGKVRYARRGACERNVLTQIVASIGLRSLFGAVIGGLLVENDPLTGLRMGLGAVPIVSACRTFRHRRRSKRHRRMFSFQPNVGQDGIHSGGQAP